MNKKLRMLLLSAILLGVPFLGSRAVVVDWMPIGDDVIDAGDEYYIALTSGTYQDGDRVWDIEQGYNDWNLSFASECTCPPDENVLNVYGTLHDDFGDEVLDGDGLPIPCSLKIDGDVHIDVLEADATMNINRSNSGERVDVVIEPYIYDYTANRRGTPGYDYSLIVFNVASGRTLTVNANESTTFRGRTIGVIPPIRSADQNKSDRKGKDHDPFEGIFDLIIVFKGSGQTKFVMSDGIIISFSGDMDTNGGITVNPDGTIEWDYFSDRAAGTKVYLTMDQTQAEVDAGQNKVLFERRNYCNPPARSMVYVGCNSLITYVSDNWTGEPDNPEVIERGGCAALGFDPSRTPYDPCIPCPCPSCPPYTLPPDPSVCTGRLILFLKGAYEFGWEWTDAGPGSEHPDPTYYYIWYKYPYNDAAVIVDGHYIPDFEDSSFMDPDTFLSSIEFGTPAGIRAKFNIVDNKYYTDADKPVSDDPDSKRLLWVINDVQNHGSLASDPYWYGWEDPFEGYYGPEWSWKWALAADPEEDYNLYHNVRHGFIIGTCGVMDIYDNAGLAYVAGALNQVDPIAEWDNFGDLSLLKKRNPSALIVDGVDETFYDAGLVEYTAGNPFLKGETARHAQVYLRGNGVAYFIASAASRLPTLNEEMTEFTTYVDFPFGYIYNFWARDPWNPFFDDPVGDPLLNWEEALAVGEKVNGVVKRVTYDGWQLDQNEMTQHYTAGVPMEGIHVLDVEGKLSTHTFANTSLYEDPYATILVTRNYAIPNVKNGIVEMSSIVRDWTGREIKDAIIASRMLTRSLSEYVIRPLLNDGSMYPRYNTPTFFFNDHAQFFDTILRHDDATKFVDGVPSDSDPAYTGGEVFYFTSYQFDAEEEYDASPDRFRWPEIRFYNSSFELHESACTSGVRFIYRDIPGSNDTTGSNTSIIKFFDHGDELDTLLKGFGRVLQFGSLYNTMADGYSNYATESSFVNVYKGNKPVYRTGTSVEDTSSKVNLSLQRGDEFPPLVGVDWSKQNAHHLFMLSQPSDCLAHCYMYIGWPRRTTTSTMYYPSYPTMPFPYGENGYPFPALPYDERTITTDPNYIFPLDAIHPHYPADPATVTIDGDLVTFGSWDENGNYVLPPVTNDERDGVIYITHGGRMTSGLGGFDPTNPLTRTNIPPQAYVDTMIVKLLWNDWDQYGWWREVQFSGITDLPADQVTFAKRYAIQMWGLTEEMFDARADQTNGYVRVDFCNKQGFPVGSRTVRADESGGEEVLFGWFDREPLPALSVTKGNVKNMIANKKPTRVLKPRRISPMSNSLKNRLTREIKGFLTRATESPDTPIERPAYLLYVGPYDDVKQMRVCGATMADPFHLDVRGDGVWPYAGRVREFTSQKTEADLFAEHFIGEGAHAVLFGENGGRIGLGDRDWNEHSVNAWNLLGKDYVSIAPLSDMTVNVNSNLIIADRLPLIATTEFGDDEVNRVTFFSEYATEIRIPSGGELDLSAFGQSTYQQEIEFAGNVKLIIEDGATIRFPSPDKVEGKGGVVLYFNDESELIFEGVEIPGEYPSPTYTLYDIIKIMGKGQIWINKDAKVKVFDDVQVGVMSDLLTPHTDVTISIQRQGQFLIGDDNNPGGIFQVGNPVTVSGDTVNFSLVLNGAQALFQVSREGVFGLGAGVLNRDYDNMNGQASVTNNPVLDVDGKAVIGEDDFPVFSPDYSKAWQVYALHDVGTITIENKQGVIQHNLMFDGSNRQGSLWMVGPAAQYIISVNSVTNAIVRGGGNIMYIPPEPVLGGTYHEVNIWDYAGEVSNGEWYAILGSAGIILNAPVIDGIETPFEGGRTATFDNAISAFNYLAFYPYYLQQAKHVCLGATQFQPTIAFINRDVQNLKYPDTYLRIVRSQYPGVINGDARESLNVGLIDARNDGDVDPTVFGNRRS